MSTICVDCRHHQSTHDGDHSCGPSASTWFYHLCASPDVKQPAKRDPVTGDVIQMLVFCRDINTDGNCSHYCKR